MDVTLALYRAVHGYLAGTEALAARLRMPRTSLLHKVSPTYPGAHCSPEEAVEIMDATGDHGALHAQAQRLGYVLLPMPALAEGQGDETARTLAATVQEFGEFMARAACDLADGRCTGTELANIEREGAESLAAIQKLLALAQQLHLAGQPPLRAVGGGKG
jgi:hypothetical protein